MLLDCPNHPTAAHIQQYLIDYVERFSLQPRLRLGTTVQKITFDEEHRIWNLVISEQGANSAVKSFDKVVIANGINHHCNVPAIENVELFKGQIFDSQAFKK